MEERQIIWPTERVMANPKIFIAIADYFEGPEWDVFSGAFYDLMESELEDSDDPKFLIGEVCFREKPDEPEVFQVVLSNGNAIELRPNDGVYSIVQSEDDLAIVSTIYGRLIKALEIARPDLKGDIALCDIPTMANGFLRDEDGDAFRGTFHLLSDPESTHKFIIDVVDIASDDLRARVDP
jgi:hypothetical protein